MAELQAGDYAEGVWKSRKGHELVRGDVVGVTKTRALLQFVKRSGGAARGITWAVVERWVDLASATKLEHAAGQKTAQQRMGDILGVLRHG